MTTMISEAQINAFLDGQLDEKEEAEVLAHLEQDPTLLYRFRRKADQKHQVTAEVDDALGDDEVDPATEALAASLSARIARQERRRRVTRWLGAGASALAIAAVGWFSHEAFVEARDPRLPPLVADAARDHQLFARSPKPVEFTASDTATMVRLFSNHLGEAVQIPDLSAIGYRLVGGRLLGAEEGPFVQLLYDDGDDHLLTVYLAKHAVPGDNVVQLAEISGLGAGYWGAEDLSYALVAEAPLEQVREIATTLTAAR